MICLLQHYIHCTLYLYVIDLAQIQILNTVIRNHREQSHFGCTYDYEKCLYYVTIM